MEMHFAVRCYLSIYEIQGASLYDYDLNWANGLCSWNISSMY